MKETVLFLIVIFEKSLEFNRLALSNDVGVRM